MDRPRCDRAATQVARWYERGLRFLLASRVSLEWADDGNASALRVFSWAKQGREKGAAFLGRALCSLWQLDCELYCSAPPVESRVRGRWLNRDRHAHDSNGTANIRFRSIRVGVKRKNGPRKASRCWDSKGP